MLLSLQQGLRYRKGWGTNKQNRTPKQSKTEKRTKSKLLFETNRISEFVVREFPEGRGMASHRVSK